MSTRDEYIEKLKAELDDLNARLKEFEAGAKAVGAQAKANLEEEYERLKAQSADAREKFQNFREEGLKNWESIVEDLDRVRDAFVHSVHYFKSQLKK